MMPSPPRLDQEQDHDFAERAPVGRGVSTTMSPVTHTAEVEVKSASTKFVQTPLRDEIGSIRSAVPTRIAAPKPRAIALRGGEAPPTRETTRRSGEGQHEK